MSDPPAEETKERPDPIKFGNEFISDVTLFVENQDFLVHRMVLAAHSDVFNAMLFGKFEEAKEDRVEIKGVSIDICKTLLEIIYYGRMSKCEALQFPTTNSTSSSNGYKIFYHNGFNTMPNAKVFYQEFWDFVNGLLAISDRFNITNLALKCLQEEITKNICPMPTCLICLNLYMFVFEKKMPILDKFHTFTKAQYKLWHNTVFEKDAPMRSQPLQINFDDIITLFDKFP